MDHFEAAVWNSVSAYDRKAFLLSFHIGSFDHPIRCKKPQITIDVYNGHVFTVEIRNQFYSLFLKLFNNAHSCATTFCLFALFIKQIASSNQFGQNTFQSTRRKVSENFSTACRICYTWSALYFEFHLSTIFILLYIAITCFELVIDKY